MDISFFEFFIACDAPVFSLFSSRFINRARLDSLNNAKVNAVDLSFRVEIYISVELHLFRPAKQIWSREGNRWMAIEIVDSEEIAVED